MNLFQTKTLPENYIPKYFNWLFQCDMTALVLA